MNDRVLNADIRANIPTCLYWNADEVAEWIVCIGFPQYKECFRQNFVTGRKLIAIDASALPAMGIYSFKDILALTKSIRDLLGIENMNPAAAMQTPMVAYLEIKRRTGKTIDNLTYHTFTKENKHWFN